MKARRRRGLLLLAVALASGGLAASQVHERERSAAAQLGPAVSVVVAARDLRAGARISARVVAVRRVPARFLPRDALASWAGVVGARLAVPVAAGGYLTPGLFEGSNSDHSGGGDVGRGWRAVVVEVSGAARPAAGSRVDVLVSTESGAGGRTLVALAGAELLRLEPGASEAVSSEAAVPSGPTAFATLRVTLRQAVYLTAADNFAREIRLLARPPGDHSVAGAAISQGQL